MAKHPIQPLMYDDHNTLRFKANKIVQHLLDNGGIDLNQIGRMDFPREDREQFAQLIGYSHVGAGELGYVSDEVWSAAEAMFKQGKCEAEARRDELADQLDKARAGMQQGVAALFGIHPDDLHVNRTQN